MSTITETLKAKLDVKDKSMDLLQAENRQLVHSGRTINVTRHHQRFFSFFCF